MSPITTNISGPANANAGKLRKLGDRGYTAYVEKTLPLAVSDKNRYLPPSMSQAGDKGRRGLKAFTLVSPQCTSRDMCCRLPHGVVDNKQHVLL